MRWRAGHECASYVRQWRERSLDEPIVQRGIAELGKHRRDWDAGEWQGYARRLVQRRHGAVNVQSVPDEVQGDCGVEFYTLDGTAYQCYAPEKTSSVKAAASGMKAKAGRDLGKLAKYRDKLGQIFGIDEELCAGFSSAHLSMTRTWSPMCARRARR